MHSTARLAVTSAVWLLVASSVSAQTTTPAPSTTAPATPSITKVSDCHPHSTVNWCMVGTDEYQVVGPTKTEEMEAQYTDCHTHSSALYCVDSKGDDVKILVNAEESTNTHNETEQHDDHDHEETNSEPAGTGQHCHDHAGVPHCTGGSAETVTCNAPVRDYNIPLRVGLLFVILVTSGLGVFMPILTTRFNLLSQTNIIFTILKQFGTGIVISTAFIHLFTHADLMFGNQCLGELEYEGTTAAIFMAGLFLSFLVDYLGARFVAWRQARAAGSSTESGAAVSHDTKTAAPSGASSNSSDVHVHAHSHGPLAPSTPLGDKINVLNLEAGIIFHSILIGITLVVASDGFFITLFIVILFHQMFEGIALGTCIAELPAAAASTLVKCVMAGVFALITPIGMAIGIGVLQHFNGNDPSTIVAIGTLDALSAGILAWVGIVEMLARDWMGPRLMSAGAVRTACAMAGLVSGLVLMSVLGKWA